MKQVQNDVKWERAIGMSEISEYEEGISENMKFLAGFSK